MSQLIQNSATLVALYGEAKFRGALSLFVPSPRRGEGSSLLQHEGVGEGGRIHLCHPHPDPLPKWGEECTSLPHVRHDNMTQ